MSEQAVTDAYDGPWGPGATWTTANMGEAAPGVLTPLDWAFWGQVANQCLPGAFAEIGALERRRAALPQDRADWIVGLFWGRTAVSVNFLSEMGDRLPGTSGAGVAEQILGYVPDSIESAPTYGRLPYIAVRFPWVFLTLPRRLRATFEETNQWWTREIARAHTQDLEAAREQWQSALRVFTRTATLQVVSLFAGVQPLFDQLAALTDRAGFREGIGSLLAGLGSHAELAVLEDLWSVSRGSGSVEEFLAQHGYHGPNEGVLSSRVWREDASPVLRLIEQYRTRPDGESPAVMLHQRAIERDEATTTLLSRLGATDKFRAKLLLRLAGKYIPLRGVGKVSYVQSIDVGRAASRRIGALLAERNIIADADDAFYLTEHELMTAAPGDDLTTGVDARRERRQEYLQLDLPGSWQGGLTMPDTSRSETTADSIAEQENRRVGFELTGAAASSGIAEGRVRVVLDPSATEVQPGEILVAPTTDPSWSVLMFSSAGLVVDVGGALSHAAVVARELGVPCVMGTRDGTRKLRTGDLCRVDGRAGTVRILELASAEPAGVVRPLTEIGER